MAVFSRNTLNRFIRALTSQGAATEFFNTYNVTTKGTAEASKALVLDASRNITNINSITSTSIVRASQIFQIGRGGTAKAGTTAGWTVNAGNNLGTIATMAQSQTAGTLVVGISGLHVGDTITGFNVYSSINSAGGAVTLDAQIRKIVIAAGATGTDSLVGAGMTQVSVSAATASTGSKTGLSEVVTAGVAYYMLLTGTTAASTTIELSQIEVVVTTA